MRLRQDKFRAVITGISFLLLLLPISTHAEGQNIAKLKTAFIYQFTKYIEWPQETLGDTFSVTLVGRGEMESALQELAREKKVRDRPISLQFAEGVDDIPPSQIVIYSSADERGLSTLLTRLRGKATLVIADAQGFAALGASLNFYVNSEGRLRFEANRKAAENLRLALSSQLLKMARLVNE